MAGIVSENRRPRPKQTGIIEDLRARIVSGKFAPGDRLPTVQRLQQEFGVSNMTIQRALTYLREHNFIRTQRGSGVYISEPPPCLCTIGVVMPYDQYKYRSQYIVAVEEEVRRLSQVESADGMRRKFVFFNEIEGPREDTQRHHQDLFHAVESELVGGLIFLRPPLRFNDTALLKNPNVPCVGTIVFPMPGVISVLMRKADMIQRALEIFASRGRKRVAWITIQPKDSEKGVAENFVSLAKKYGLESHPWWVQGISDSSPEWAENYTELLFRIRQADRPDAVIIDDDNLIPHATAGLAAANVRIPDDVEVIAYTNFPYPTHSEVPIVRIGLDVRRLFKTALELIERKRRGENVPEMFTIEPCLEEEASI